MSSIAIIFGAISVFLLVTGILGVVGGIRNEESLVFPNWMTMLGAVGLFLCLAI